MLQVSMPELMFFLHEEHYNQPYWLINASLSSVIWKGLRLKNISGNSKGIWN